MRYAIISDIHGNLAALQHVIKKIEEKGCDRIICLGDVVGYGPFPNECCDIIQKTADVCLLGNHDAAVVGLMDVDYFNRYAKSAIAWSAQVLNEASRSFITGLPFTAEEDDLLFVHASPKEPNEWQYVLSLDDAFEQFSALQQRVCFIGHSHVPVVWILRESGLPEHRSAKHFRTVRGARHIINVGSVGQPRDNNPEAGFGIYDTDTGWFELQRTPYDIAETQKAMSERGLPEFLIERLQFGK
jgi:diadenosine tetraphosphatase ApaH/serine/threonine PP2A family protein phosphatase